MDLKRKMKLKVSENEKDLICYNTETGIQLYNKDLNYLPFQFKLKVIYDYSYNR